jgi:hypothetical protein
MGIVYVCSSLDPFFGGSIEVAKEARQVTLDFFPLIPQLHCSGAREPSHSQELEAPGDGVPFTVMAAVDQAVLTFSGGHFVNTCEMVRKW